MHGALNVGIFANGDPGKGEPGKRILRHIASGRWEPVGAWWVEADTNLPSETGLLKQAQVGQSFARRHLGRQIEVAYLPDSFGHPATLP